MMARWGSLREGGGCSAGQGTANGIALSIEMPPEVGRFTTAQAHTTFLEQAHPKNSTPPGLEMVMFRPYH